MRFWDFGIPSWLISKTHIGNLYWTLNCSWILRLWLDFWDFANWTQAGLFESYPSQFWAFLSLLCIQIVSFFSYIWKGKKGQFLRFPFFLCVKLYASCTRKWALFRGWFRAKFCLPVAAFASSARHCEPGLDSRLRGTRSSLLIFSLGTRKRDPMIGRLGSCANMLPKILCESQRLQLILSKGATKNWGTRTFDPQKL